MPNTPYWRGECWTAARPSTPGTRRVGRQPRADRPDLCPQAISIDDPTGRAYRALFDVFVCPKYGHSRLASTDSERQGCRRVSDSRSRALGDAASVT